MKRINYNTILEKANTLYSETKLAQKAMTMRDAKYLSHPIPKIESEQVKAVTRILVDEMNRLIKEFTEEIQKERGEWK